MVALGIGGVVLSVDFYSLVLLGLGVAVGVPLAWSGIDDRREQRLDAAERARAEAELPALREVVTAAVASGRQVGRVLRERGFVRARVRHWIALECGVVLREGANDVRPW